MLVVPQPEGFKAEQRSCSGAFNDLYTCEKTQMLQVVVIQEGVLLINVRLVPGTDREVISASMKPASVTHQRRRAAQRPCDCQTEHQTTGRRQLESTTRLVHGYTLFTCCRRDGDNVGGNVHVSVQLPQISAVD